VHGRHRLGHGPQLHRVRAPREPRDQRHVRGHPELPTMSRFWEIVEKYKVTSSTRPHPIRAIAKEGDTYVKKCDCLAAHPRNGRRADQPRGVDLVLQPDRGRQVPIVDTWWQTETGGILITPLPGAIKIKPGSATLPFFGVQPTIVNDEGKELEGPCSGNLCIKAPWPGMMRTVYGDHERFRQTYFSQYDNKYFTGDGATATRTATTGSRAAWTTSSTSRVIASARPRSRAPGVPRDRGRGGRGRLPARHQGPGHLRVRDAEHRA